MLGTEPEYFMHVREGESIQEWAIQGRDHVLIYLGILMPGTGSRLHICLMNEMVFTPLTDPSPYQSHSLIATSQFIMHPQPHWPLSFPWICTAPSCQNVWVSVAQSCPTLLPHGLEPTRLLCPWDFPGKNARVGCHFLLQGIVLTQGLNPGLPHWRRILHLHWQWGPSPATGPLHARSPFPSVFPTPPPSSVHSSAHTPASLPHPRLF